MYLAFINVFADILSADGALLHLPRERSGMNVNRGAIRLSLFCVAFAGFVLPSTVSADDTSPNAFVPVSTASARASAIATIVEPPRLRCGQALPNVTIEISTFPPPAHDHVHPGVVAQLDCSGFTTAPNGIVDRKGFADAKPHAKSELHAYMPSAHAGPVGNHQHTLEVVFNFE